MTRLASFLYNLIMPCIRTFLTRNYDISKTSKVYSYVFFSPNIQIYIKQSFMLVHPYLVYIFKIMCISYITCSSFEYSSILLSASEIEYVFVKWHICTLITYLLLHTSSSAWSTTQTVICFISVCIVRVKVYVICEISMTQDV